MDKIKKIIPRNLSIEQKIELGYYPSKEEVYKKYIVENLSAPQCSEYFNISRSTFDLLKKFFKLEKTPEQIKLSKDAVLIKKYGCTNPAKLDSSKQKAKETCLKKYGNESFLKTDKFKKQSQKTLKEKYGVKNIQQVEEIRQQTKETMLQKYGYEYATQAPEVKDKTKNTNLKKYGVEYVQQNKDVKQKGKNTNMNKYGCENPFQNNEIKEKIKKVVKDKYGVEHISQSEEIRQKIKDTNFQKYGASYAIQKDINNLEIWESSKLMKEYLLSLPERPTVHNLEKFFNADDTSVLRKIHSYGLEKLVDIYPNRSGYEDEIIELLREKFNIQNIEINKRDLLPSGREIDIYLPDYRIGIEFNGEYWHSDVIPKFQDHNGRSHYHQEKSLEAEKQDIFLFHIFEHEWSGDYFGKFFMNKKIKEEIIYRLQTLLQKNERVIPARKCKVKEIGKEEAELFFKQNHIQGKEKNSNYFLGLFYKNELVSCMGFGPSKYKKYNYELIRFASLNNTTVQGGASKLFKYFVTVKLKDGDIVVSYNDITKTKGNIYKILGFDCKSINDPNYWWVNLKTKEVRTRYQEQRSGEAERMHSQGFVRVCDCGTRTWIYKK